MIVLDKLRKIAAIALLLCFFLPLSKCSGSSESGTATYDYRFPFENVAQGLCEILEGGNPDSLPLAVATLIVFLLPAVLLKVGVGLQSIADAVLAVPAEWLLYHWVTIGQPQIGGILAMLGWAVLFVVGVARLGLGYSFGKRAGESR